MAVPCIVLCPEAQAANLSKVFEAMGRGPNTFSSGRKVCAKSGSATSSTPPTHRLTQDNSATAELEDMWRKMAAGDAMPQVIWADHGLTEQEANAAAQSMTVQSVAGQEAQNVSAESFLDGLNLQFVPDPAI